MFSVYKHIFPNGKVYIGITGQSLSRRWQRGEGYKHQPQMINAIHKYGWDNIQHVVVKSGLSREEAEILEIELIKEFDSTNPLNGYNRESGGNVNKTISAETIERVRLAHLGKRQSKETRVKRSQSIKKAHQSGLFDNADRSFLHSDAYREKISNIRRLTWSDPEYRRKMSEKSKTVQSDAVYKKQKSETAKRINNISEIKAKFTGENNGKSKPCVCVETGIEYPCVADASRRTSAPLNSIAMCCRGIRKTAGGFHWVFKDVVEEVT